MPKRLQLSRRKGYRLPANAVNVARPTKWGNPWKKHDAGNIDALLYSYRSYVRTVLEYEPTFMDPLRGRDLACWCKLCPKHAAGKPLGEECADCAPCHADVLGELLGDG